MKQLIFGFTLVALFAAPALATDGLIDNHPNGWARHLGPYVSIGAQMTGYQIIFTPDPFIQEFMDRREAEGQEYIGTDEAFYNYTAWRRPIPKDEADYQAKFKADEFKPHKPD